MTPEIKPFKVIVIILNGMFSLQGPKSEDDMGDGAEAVDHEPDELSGYEPESDVNTMTVPVLYLFALFCTPYSLYSLHVVTFLQLDSHIPDNN